MYLFIFIFNGRNIIDYSVRIHRQMMRIDLKSFLVVLLLVWLVSFVILLRWDVHVGLNRTFVLKKMIDKNSQDYEIDQDEHHNQKKLTNEIEQLNNRIKTLELELENLNAFNSKQKSALEILK